MDVAGDFIYTAALLIHIKSKMLLPRAPIGPEELPKIRAANSSIACSSTSASTTPRRCCRTSRCSKLPRGPIPACANFAKTPAPSRRLPPTPPTWFASSATLSSARAIGPILNVEEDSVTVGQMIQFLTRRLTMEDKPVALRRLLSHTHSERALIAMFLALLELVRLQAILLRQDRHFSEIFIKKNTGFDAAMNQGLTDARDDWR